MRQVKSPLEFLRGNYTFMKLVVQVNRGAKERAFFKNLFGDLITKVIKNESLDLETNPMVIYQKRISKEESKTGQPSAEPYYIDQEKALRSTEVAADLNRHIESLVNITEEFLCAIIRSTDEMPFGLRVIARELRMVMEESFPGEDPANINMILGNFISYRYLSPAIT
jgi:Ras GTPase-activating-like protein IQGAP2/3